MNIAFGRIAAAGLAAALMFAAGNGAAGERKKAPKSTVLHDFCQEANCTDGAQPVSAMLRDPATGTLYGMAEQGGKFGAGVIFSLTPNAKRSKWKYSVIHDFCALASCTDGQGYVGNFIMDTSGALYGVSSFEGAHRRGNVFKLTPNAKHTKWTFAVLYDFCALNFCMDGSEPYGGLTYAGAETGALYDGTSPLYGTTYNGSIPAIGASDGGGVVYQLTKNGDGWSESVLQHFCQQDNCPDGAYLYGNLVIDAAGDLFGTTSRFGGSGHAGTAFELSPSAGRTSWSFTTLYRFCADATCTDGANPQSEMIRDQAGDLLGTAYGGTGAGNTNFGGVVYKLTPNGAQTKEAALYDLCSAGGCADGDNPRSGLAIDSQGNLYGTASQGGNASGDGVLYTVSPSGHETVLHTFCSETACADGATPMGGVTLGDDGVLYGTASAGGANGKGVILQITPR